ncbi:uncharacterized protein F58A4.6-like isoform X1 [Branchiostoma floridae x Branchiostoma belcheri]
MAARGAIVQYLSRSTQTEAICLKLPSDLASCLFLELSRSPAYTLRFARSKRLHPLVTQKVHLENLFSYLCTVGGAYSALGDYNMYHADQAAVVSLQQLKIASTLGDPVLLSCCCLWYALSLMQKGLFKQAENIVSKQYQFSKTPEAGCNQRLQKMCQGIWNKIKAMKTVRGTQNNHLEPRAPKELY